MLTSKPENKKITKKNERRLQDNIKIGLKDTLDNMVCI